MNDAPRIALVGNPNAGKTTAFNKYTGGHQHVGNYPGVTVEKKEGTVRVQGEKINLIDLPGVYSLTAYSEEELVARDQLLYESPLAIIDVVDTGALERNLYLTVQLLEMGQPLALACNMFDEARKAGIIVDLEKLGERLGIPCVPTIARSGEGLDEVLQKALELGRKRQEKNTIEGLHLSYGPDLDPVLATMEKELHGKTPDIPAPPRWIAVKLLEGDSNMWAILEKKHPEMACAFKVLYENLQSHVQTTLRTGLPVIISDYRYGFIRAVLRDNVVTQSHSVNTRLAVSDKVDAVLLNSLLGPCIMVAVLFGIFQLTFALGAYPQGWIEEGFAWLGQFLSNTLPEGLVRSLVVDGILGGIGGILSFVPLIMIIFFCIAILEDSGYMARIACMLDRIFHMFGLHGCSVMPYLISGGIAGGCAIPGAMATRSLRSPKEKLATLLTVPFMACGAKLPIFMLLTGVFFPGQEANMMFILVCCAWIVALLVARLLRSTLLRGASAPFVLELPPYRLPTIQGLCIHAWERTWLYIKKAGTVLVCISILIWASLTFPQLPAEKLGPYEATRAKLEEQLVQAETLDSAQREAIRLAIEEAQTALNQEQNAETLRYSVAGRLGTAIEPVSQFAGFNWKINIALISGIAAKEAIVSTLGIVYSLGETNEEETEALSAIIATDPGWTKASALAVMLFVLFYSPCFVALIVITREAGSWKWLLFSLFFNTGFAFGVASIVFHVGRLFITT